MDFYKIRLRESKGVLQAYPDWIVGKQEDLMVRGGHFYAIWDEKKGMWSTNEYDVQRIVDADLIAFVEEQAGPVEPLLTRNFSTGSWESFNRYIRNLPDAAAYKQLDEKLTFADDVVTKKDYVSKRLSYSLQEGKIDSWDELVGVLYSPTERDKIEWIIGSIVSGASKWIQKFLVFYGPPGSGKSTVIGIVERLFEGYIATFEAKALTSNAGSFSMEPFEHNPLVAIQHDGDLSRIEDNTRLNSIVGHDMMNINAKYKSAYSIRPNAMLIMGTNKPVKITDAKAGNTRRLIDVHPTGVKVSPSRYHVLVENINFELGAIAYHCLKKYEAMGKYYYDSYVPSKMMMLTDSFYNFIEANFDIFKQTEGVQIKRVWTMYKEYCEEMNIVKRLQYHEVKDELGSYFATYKDRHWVGDKEIRSVYLDFKGLPGEGPPPFVPDTSYVVELKDSGEDNVSSFDLAYPTEPAQYAGVTGTPQRTWENSDTCLADLDTSKLHYVKVPENHIVIDFDLKDESGEKDLELNIAEASKLPPTYAEVSKSGKGLHLHYIYRGDVRQLSSVLAEGIEVKTLLGDSSLRRQLTKCNGLDITTISGGLPKKEAPMLDATSVKSEKGLRTLIHRNLRKEIHPGTKPSLDFIHHILEEAYESGVPYDVSDLRPTLLAFAAKSTNQSRTCIGIVQSCKLASERPMPEPGDTEGPLVFFDVEVYPNLFVVCWKKEGSDQVVRMINPRDVDVEPLTHQKLVGFNNRRYDNHILYAACLGYTPAQLFELSQKLINGDDRKASFGEAYNLSYTDIYDFSSKKQGLKKFQIELGIFHVELDIPWDEPVDEGLWSKVEEYCVNDVISTEAVFNARKQDFVARQILADLSGLTVNHTTQQHTARIIFGDDKHPQRKFVYTDLSVEFPGYSFDGKTSSYHGENPSEGGYVYAEPGAYFGVAVLDVASMHPTSIEQLQVFGPYTEKFSELKQARMAIKHQDLDTARVLLDGKLAKYLERDVGDEYGLEDLSYALKIVINIVYGLTSARFDNMFRDNRNVDNIVAKRGALFMIDLKAAVQDRGFQVVHIKTDSIKIPGATSEIINFITQFGKEYGYDFEHETTYEAFCLVNDAVFVARCDGKWTTVGAQFQHPYVRKELFTKEPLDFWDLCETKNVVKGRIYLDLSGSEDPSDWRHIGRTGSFVPVNHGGGTLWRVQDGKSYHVTGTKGYSWIDSDLAQEWDKIGELDIDMTYFQELKRKAVEAIEQFIPFGDFTEG